MLLLLSQDSTTISTLLTILESAKGRCVFGLNLNVFIEVSAGVILIPSLIKLDKFSAYALINFSDAVVSLLLSQDVITISVFIASLESLIMPDF